LADIPYAASKAALNRVTTLLAAALAPEIRVNAIPGFRG
jgi:NAD(P)-dependent dehydrogenase (short-subunit alcohol dehydrogenase family)